MEKIGWTDRVRNEEVLHIIEEDRNILSSSISRYFVAPNIKISKNTKYTLDKHALHTLCVHILRCELASVALSPKAGTSGQQKECVSFVI
jgi:hypothetical protein